MIAAEPISSQMFKDLLLPLFPVWELEEAAGCTGRQVWSCFFTQEHTDFIWWWKCWSHGRRLSAAVIFISTLGGSYSQWASIKTAKHTWAAAPPGVPLQPLHSASGGQTLGVGRIRFQQTGL